MTGRTTKITTEHYLNTSSLNKYRKLPFDKLKYGSLILFQGQHNDINLLKTSANKSNVTFELKEYTKDNTYIAEFVINDIVAGKSEQNSAKLAKKQAFINTTNELCKEAIVLSLNEKADQISISKQGNVIKAFVEKIDEGKLEIDSTNIGYKMMQKLGWTGGGLGSNKDGMREPISLDFGQTTRHGLGAKSTLDEGDMDKLNFEYCRQLFKNYCASEEIRDLKFTSAFSKNQRASLHGYV